MKFFFFFLWKKNNSGSTLLPLKALPGNCVDSASLGSCCFSPTAATFKKEKKKKKAENSLFLTAFHYLITFYLFKKLCLHELFTKHLRKRENSEFTLLPLLFLGVLVGISDSSTAQCWPHKSRVALIKRFGVAIHFSLCQFPLKYYRIIKSMMANQFIWCRRTKKGGQQNEKAQNSKSYKAATETTTTKRQHNNKRYNATGRATRQQQKHKQQKLQCNSKKVVQQQKLRYKEAQGNNTPTQQKSNNATKSHNVTTKPKKQQPKSNHNNKSHHSIALAVATLFKTC